MVRIRQTRLRWRRSRVRLIAALGALVFCTTTCEKMLDTPPVLLELFVTPTASSLAPGATTQFVASAAWSNGEALLPDVTFRAEGGTITPAGLFTAGVVAGTFPIIVSATGSALADTAFVTVTPTPIVLLDLAISPATASLNPLASVQLSVSGVWSDGSTVAPVVAYTATGGSVTNTGLFTAGASAGAARIIATQFGGSISDTAVVTITSPPGAAPILEEDFSTYSSTANFHSDPRNIYANEEFGGPWGQWNRIELDTTTGIVDIGAGASRKSMKYTWPNRANATGIQPDAPRCVDFYILKALPIAPVPELWAEFYVKFSSNWTSRAPASWNCTSNPDYKFIFLTTTPGGRFSLKNDYAGLGTRWDPTAPTQGDGDNNFVYNTWHDDRWHRIRIHAKLSLGGTNGIHRVWLDDVLVYSRTNISTGSVQTGINGLSLGNNMNQGPGQIQTLHWGLIRAYTANPGW